MFLFAILFIWVVSSLILYLIHLLIPSVKKHTVGFSAVLFGLMIVYISLLYRDKNPYISYGGLIISILPQLMVPGISFVGHLCGILAGIIFVLLFPVNKNISADKLSILSGAKNILPGFK